ncbi:hypothetical protein, partial [Bradyrhizobium sp. NAS80.1]|uniref:hypothetical protein n=1 Tax=Bradyrhizobium sp. NAS80.1 TaxID=1680159 RepID=UPI001AEF668C
CWFPLPLDVCSSPKVTYLLRGSEMTRRAQEETCPIGFVCRTIFQSDLGLRHVKPGDAFVPLDMPVVRPVD